MAKIARYLLLYSIAVFAAVFLWGQQQAPAPPSNSQDGYKIGVEVNMVTVPVTVRHPEGGFIKGLSQKAFHLYEDGEDQEIELFTQEGVPTRIAIVLDVSGSVRSEWGTIKYATKKFVENLKPEDAFALVSFNSEIRLKMDWGRKTDRVDSVLTSIYCKDNTKLWDAIHIVCTDVFKGIKEKRAVIIMSDGLDNESFYTYDEALQAAIRSEAAIYVVSKTEAIRQMLMYEQSNAGWYGNIPQQAFVQADLALRRIAFETGGRVIYPNNFGQLDNVYAQVNEELRSQYTIGYISRNTTKDGSYRHIDVRVEIPGAQVSARPGYYAPDDLGTRPGAQKSRSTPIR
jgi:Ca-activated chloride channel homolog